LSLFQKKKNNSEKLAYDFVADIPDVDIHEFYSDLKQQLTSDYKIINETVESGQICSTFTTKRYRFFRHFIGSAPPEFTCYIKKPEQAKPTVCANFSYPKWFRLFLYFAIFIIACFFHVPLWIIHKYIFSGLLGYGVLGVFQCTVFLTFFVSILILVSFAVIHIFSLLYYKRWMGKRCTTSYQHITSCTKKIHHKWNEKHRRIMILKRIYVSFLFILLLGLYFFWRSIATKDNLEIFDLQNSHIISVLLIIIFWLIYFCIHSSKKKYDFRRMETLVANFFLALSLAAVLQLPVFSDLFLNISNNRVKDGHALLSKTSSDYEKNDTNFTRAGETITLFKCLSFIT
jgi:hypothetical protein